MKVVYKICCGVDVHKSFLVATINKTTSEVQPSYQKKCFSTFNNSILESKKWLLDNSCLDICMESHRSLQIDMPEPLKEKQKEKAIKQAKKLLIAEGIIDKSLIAS